MHRNLIENLRCPYTGSPFEVQVVSRQHDKVIDFGVVNSEAGQFPIISGILRLIPDELQIPLANLVKQGREEEALMAAIEMPFRDKWASMTNRLWRARYQSNLGLMSRIAGPSKRRLYRLVTQSDITFRKLAIRTGKETWGKWQTFRFSMSAFLAVYALSHLVRGCSTILDFGCGLGQSAFIMKRIAPEAMVVCADYSFTSLYLSKQFVVPDAQYVCLDGGYPLPFGGNYFDCVFSTDALQYIESKLGLAKEFQRVLSNNGTIALAHLHNRLSPVKSGKALTASGYDGLFTGMVRRVYPEDNIVADYIANGALDLDRRWALDDLHHALNGLSLVAANRESSFCTYTGLLDAYIDAMRNPRLNPAYRARQSDKSWILERSIDAPYAVERTIQDRVLLPRNWRIDIESLDSSKILNLRDQDKGQIRELVRRFLILDMPERYI